MIRSRFRRLERALVVVHTQDDQSIRGRVKDSRGDAVVLADPEYLGKAPETVKGEVWVPLANVSWVQRLVEVA